MSSRIFSHRFLLGDARDLSNLSDKSIGLVVTSPPYWNLKQYNDNQNQLGSIDDYNQFVEELDKVWAECLRVLIPGGRLVVVVGDVLLSRKKHGRHRCIPLHSSIQLSCLRLGFDPLAPIFWHKISNATTESSRSSTFLGKPYEPNAIIKHDVEYIMFFRKSGGYRSPSGEMRAQSRLSKEEFQQWFQQIWTDIPGERQTDHPAPFPEELAYRLIRMFSFWSDTVLDPFCGTGTTMLAAMRANRNSVGFEIDPVYYHNACERLARHGERSNVSPVETVFNIFQRDGIKRSAATADSDEKEG